MIPIPKKVRKFFCDMDFKFLQTTGRKKYAIAVIDMRCQTRVIESYEINLPRMAVNPQRKTAICRKIKALN